MSFDDTYRQFRKVMFPTPKSEQEAKDQQRQAKALIRKMKPKTVEERELQSWAEEAITLIDLP